jgi:hypothetical protein
MLNPHVLLITAYMDSTECFFGRKYVVFFFSIYVAEKIFHPIRRQLHIRVGIVICFHRPTCRPARSRPRGAEKTCGRRLPRGAGWLCFRPAGCRVRKVATSPHGTSRTGIICGWLDCT